MARKSAAHLKLNKKRCKDGQKQKGARFLAPLISFFSVTLGLSGEFLANPALHPKTPATSANAMDGAACAEPWPRSAVYARASQQTIGRLPRAYARSHLLVQ